MLKRWLLAAGLLAAFAAVAAASDDADGRMLPDPNQARVEEPPQLPSVHGKYRVLLRKIHVPQDTNAYGKFTDYGMYTGNAWAGYNDLPPGYWVYVYPNWYIWRDCVKPNLIVPQVPNPNQGIIVIPPLEAPGQGANPKLNEEQLKKLVEELKKIEKEQPPIERRPPRPVDDEELKKIEQQQKK